MYTQVGTRPTPRTSPPRCSEPRWALCAWRHQGGGAAYLLVTARTVLASHWRRRLGLPVTSVEPGGGMPYLAEPSGPSEPTDAPERAGAVLAALPDRYRRVLELRFLEACSIKEVAKTMDISVSNAKVLQHRALHMAAKVAQDPGPMTNRRLSAFIDALVSRQRPGRFSADPDNVWRKSCARPSPFKRQADGRRQTRRRVRVRPVRGAG